MTVEMKHQARSESPIDGLLMPDEQPAARTAGEKARILARLATYLAALDNEEGRQDGNA